MSWVKKLHSAERSVTLFWCRMRDLKRNRARQIADIHLELDSYMNTKMKDPNSNEGDREEY